MSAILSVRVRLTLIYMLLLGAALFLYGFFIFAVFLLNLAVEMDDSLQSRSQDIVRLYLENPVTFTFQSIEPFSTGGYMVQRLDNDGRVLEKTRNLGDGQLPADITALRVLAQAQPVYSSLVLDGESVRLRTSALIQRDTREVLGYIQVAKSQAGDTQTLGNLLRLLASAGLGALVLASVLGYLFAARAFRPIDRLTQIARRIAVSGNLSERVPGRAREDELGRLAKTFNEMLDTIETAYQRQDRALDVQRRFVADASHELRTPLTTILGNLDVIARHPEMRPQDREEALSDATSEARRMRRLIDDLLFLARADAGQTFQREEVALDDAVRSVARQARLLAEGREVELRQVLPGIAMASPDHIRQVLLILADNAAKHTPAGGRITIETRVDTAAGMYGITVRDDGVGIAARDLPHVFDRFYQASDSRNAEGSGLGLSIAKWLVEQHDGRIDAASELGRGASFTVWLPLARSSVPARA